MSRSTAFTLLVVALTVLVPWPIAAGTSRPDACAEILQRFRSTLASAPMTCAGNEGCLIYAGGLTDCGGVVDRTTGKRLEAIHAEYYKRGCRIQLRCAAHRPWIPVCVKRRCSVKTD